MQARVLSFSQYEDGYHGMEQLSLKEGRSRGKRRVSVIRLGRSDDGRQMRHLLAFRGIVGGESWQIPPGATIHQAVLRLTLTGPDWSAPLQVSSLPGAWGPRGATCFRNGLGAEWSICEAGGEAPRDEGLSATRIQATRRMSYSIDVTESLRRQVAALAINDGHLDRLPGWLLASASGEYFEFFSAERHPDRAGNQRRPRLLVALGEDRLVPELAAEERLPLLEPSPRGIADSERAVLLDEDGRTFVRGRPYLPFGIAYWQGVPSSEQLEAFHFNLLEWTTPGHPVDWEFAERNDIMIGVIPPLPEVLARGRSSVGSDFPRHQSALLYYLLGDDLTLAKRQRVIARRNAVVEADPLHLTLGHVKASDLRNVEAYADIVDVPLFYSYGHLRSFRDYLGQLEAVRARFGGRFVYSLYGVHFPLSMSLNRNLPFLQSKKYPSPAQMRILHYLQLAAGVRGFLAYAAGLGLGELQYGVDKLQERGILGAELKLIGEEILLAEEEPLDRLQVDSPEVRGRMLRRRGGDRILLLHRLPEGVERQVDGSLLTDLRLELKGEEIAQNAYEVSFPAVTPLAIDQGRIEIPRFELTSLVVVSEDEEWVDELRRGMAALLPSVAEMAVAGARYHLRHKVGFSAGMIEQLGWSHPEVDRALRHGSMRVEEAGALLLERRYEEAFEAARSAERHAREADALIYRAAVSIASTPAAPERLGVFLLNPFLSFKTFAALPQAATAGLEEAGWRRQAASAGGPVGSVAERVHRLTRRDRRRARRLPAGELTEARFDQHLATWGSVSGYRDVVRLDRIGAGLKLAFVVGELHSWPELQLGARVLGDAYTAADPTRKWQYFLWDHPAGEPAYLSLTTTDAVKRRLVDRSIHGETVIGWLSARPLQPGRRAVGELVSRLPMRLYALRLEGGQHYELAVEGAPEVVAAVLVAEGEHSAIPRIVVTTGAEGRAAFRAERSTTAAVLVKPGIQGTRDQQSIAGLPYAVSVTRAEPDAGRAHRTEEPRAGLGSPVE